MAEMHYDSIQATASKRLSMILHHFTGKALSHWGMLLIYARERVAKSWDDMKPMLLSRFSTASATVAKLKRVEFEGDLGCHGRGVRRQPCEWGIGAVSQGLEFDFKGLDLLDAGRPPSVTALWWIHVVRRHRSRSPFWRMPVAYRGSVPARRYAREGTERDFSRGQIFFNLAQLPGRHGASYSCLSRAARPSEQREEHPPERLDLEYSYALTDSRRETTENNAPSASRAERSSTPLVSPRLICHASSPTAVPLLPQNPQIVGPGVSRCVWRRYVLCNLSRLEIVDMLSKCLSGDAISLQAVQLLKSAGVLSRRLMSMKSR
ncbi:hypothetical protein Efla_003571 [Eimeria flavescens]